MPHSRILMFAPDQSQVPLLWEMHAVDQDAEPLVDRTTAGNKVVSVRCAWCVCGA